MLAILLIALANALLQLDCYVNPNTFDSLTTIQTTCTVTAVYDDPLNSISNLYFAFRFIGIPAPTSKTTKTILLDGASKSVSYSNITNSLGYNVQGTLQLTLGSTHTFQDKINVST